MKYVRVLGCLLSCGALSGCALEAGDAVDAMGAPLGELDQPIVRGHETERFPQVMMLHVRRSTSTTRCSATLIAPRLILTAAHCIGEGAIPSLSYVYYGRDEAPPSGETPPIPPPGEASDLALIESFLVHPDYDPAVNYPDLAVAYLDRELPFEPLPLLKERVGRRLVGSSATIVGWGGSRALVADISQVEGAGVERVGKVTLLGSPTLADFHEDDPNPGMLDAAIRADSLKTDGRAPNQNPCAGDSGGPLLLKEHGRYVVAGVGYWTGLWCEDYAIFSRIDPFLRFLADAQRGLGRKNLTPRLECVDQAEDGSFTAFFGVQNDNGITLDIPFGARNRLRADRDGVRPESFGPGDHPWAFALGFRAGEQLSYTLAPRHAPAHTVVASQRSPRCECAAACEASLLAECSSGTFSRADCIASCAPFAQAFPGCQPELDAYWACVGQLPAAGENWICDPDVLPQPVACQDEFFNALVCGGYL